MARGDPGFRIHGARLLDSLAALARIGETPEGGAERLAFTAADGRGRDLVRSWMEEAGLQVRVDGIGNVIGRREECEDREAAAVMLGSHIDTVGNGGRYDGNLGVLAALEVARTLNRNRVRTVRPLEVAAFSNEEGSRYHPDMMGSLVYIGGFDVERARALESPDGPPGRTLGSELESIGYLGDAPLPGPVPAAYVELHIEQGPVLEAEGVEIGAVTGVQGILWEEITLTGVSNHAGTTRCGSGATAAWWRPRRYCWRGNSPRRFRARWRRSDGRPFAGTHECRPRAGGLHGGSPKPRSVAARGSGARLLFRPLESRRTRAGMRRAA